MCFDQRPELPRCQPVALEVALGRDRRRAGALVQQRDLAEVIARPEPAAVLAADGHLCLTGLDHEEADTALPFGRDRVAGRERPLLHRRRDALKLLPIEVGEDRHALQEFDCALGHCEDYATLTR